MNRSSKSIFDPKNSYAYNQDYSAGRVGNVFNYTTSQTRILSTSLFVAAVGFLLTFLIGLITQRLIVQFAQDQDTYSITALWAVTTIMFLIGTIMSFIWVFRVHKASTTFSLVTIGCYVIGYGISLGAFLFLLGYQDVMFAFLTVGLLLLVAFTISRALSFKAALNLRKFIIFGSIGLLVSYLIMFPLSLIFSRVSGFNSTVYYVTLIFSGLLGFAFLVFNLWNAQKMDQFYIETNIRKKLALFIGFQILVSLLQLLFFMLRMLAAFRYN